MKCTRYISLMIALLSVLGIAAQQQQSQYALYNYRNDGDFNAWLNIDVDSITYSTIGLDSIEYDNIVTQEVWTPDSCYRIPIEAIDSIGFRAPKPEYRPNVYHIRRWHLPYIVKKEGMVLYMSCSIATDSVPSIGQVIVSDVFEEPLQYGFSGRVLSIQTTDDAYVIACEAVTLEDVFSRLLLVGRTYTVSEDDPEAQTRRKAVGDGAGGGGVGSWNDDDWDGTFPITLGKINKKIPNVLGWVSNKMETDDNTIGTMTIEPKFDISYILDVHPFRHSYVKLLFENRTKTSTEYHLKVDGDVDNIGDIPTTSTFYLSDVKMPVVAGLLYADVALKGKLDIKGELDLKASLTKTIYNGDEYEWDSSDFWNIKHTRYDTDPKWKETDNITYEDGDFYKNESEVSFSFKGTFGFGLSFNLAFYVLSEDFLKINNAISAGPELSGSLTFSSDGLKDGTWYSTLKNTNITYTPLKLADEVAFKIIGRDFKWLKWEHGFGEEKYRLFPDFTEPTLSTPQQYRSDGYNPFGLYTKVTKDVIPLLPLKIGIGRYDGTGEKLDDSFSLNYYQEEKKWDNSWVHYDLRLLPPNSTFTYRPLLRIWGFEALEFNAVPEAEFTVPEPMTIGLDTPLNSVTLKKGLVRYIAINGGWGDYSAHSSMRAICSADIEMFNDKPCVKLSASKLMTGSTTVTVKDLRSGETKTISVTVSDDAVPGELALSEQTVSLQEDESATVLITSGSGNYIAESSSPNVASAIIDGNKVIITAISKGSAVITVTDTETEETATIEVTVKEAVAGGDIFDVGLPPSTTLSPDIQWEADMMIFNNGEKYYSGAKNQVIGTPPSDVNGNEWYALNYQLTNGEETWNVGKAPFSSDATYNGKPSTRWTTDGIMADIYLRRTFTVGHELPDNILFSCCHDDAPAEWYLNGVLIRSIDDGWNYDDKVYLTPEQCALIHTDGTKNVLALHVHNNWGGAFADGGLYEKPSPQKAINEILDNMVYVSGGTFMMGATEEQGDEAFDAEKPAHQVTVPSFYINRYEVTQEQWEAIMSYNNSKNKGDRHPVENFTYSECQTFIDKLSELTGKKFRLPTEAEWEYAARGGNKSRGYKYAGSNNIDEVAWYGGGDYNGGNGGNSGSAHHEVGLKKPNELGLYDMTGNVWEHTSDNYYPYEEEAVYNPKHEGGSNARIDRGGSYGWQPRYCRVSFRDNIISSYGKCDDNGFRLVLDTSEFGSGSGAGGGSGGSW